MTTRNLISVIGGFTIGLGIFVVMTVIIQRLGIYGWFFLPIVLALAVFLALLVLCLPYYFKERKAFRRYEQKHNDNR